jgi:excisionase family DNA binding protein
MTLFTPHEAAVQLKVKANTVIKMFDNGELPGVILRQGLRKRILRFSDDALRQFIAAKEQRVPQAK